MEEFEIRVPKIHSISKLVYLVDANVKIEVNEDIIIALDSLYLESRYPGEFGLLPEGLPTRKQAESFLLYAAEIFESIKSQLEGKK